MVQSLGAVLLLLLSSSCLGQTTYEINAGSARTGIDVVFSASLDSLGRWSMLSRNLASVFYDKSTTLVSFNSFACALKGGLAVASNSIYTSQRFYSALGLQYIYSRREWFIYIYVTKEVNRNSFHDHFAVVAWQPSVSKRVRLLLQNEMNVTMYGARNSFTLERLKFGVNLHDRWQTGVLAEMTSAKENFRVNHRNLGIFVKKLI